MKLWFTVALELFICSSIIILLSTLLVLRTALQPMRTHPKQGQLLPTFPDNSDSFLTLNPVLLCGCFQLNLLLLLSFLSLPGGL